MCNNTNPKRFLLTKFRIMSFMELIYKTACYKLQTLQKLNPNRLFYDK